MGKMYFNFETFMHTPAVFPLCRSMLIRVNYLMLSSHFESRRLHSSSCYGQCDTKKTLGKHSPVPFESTGGDVGILVLCTSS